MKVFWNSLLLALLTTGFANADIMVRSAIPGKLVLSYTLPSGEAKETVVYAGNPLGAGNITLPDTAAGVQARVSDEFGSSVWTGELKNGFWILLHSDPNGKSVMRTAGYVTNRSGSYPPGAQILNITGEPIKLDLFGQLGVGGLTNSEVPASPDDATLVKLPAGESIFQATIRSAEGAVLNKSRYGISAGSWFALTKAPDDGYGAYQLVQLGWIKE